MPYRLRPERSSERYVQGERRHALEERHPALAQQVDETTRRAHEDVDALIQLHVLERQTVASPRPENAMPQSPV